MPSEHNIMRPFKRVRRAFDAAALIRTCERGEEEFEEAYAMQRWDLEPDPDPRFRWTDEPEFYLFKDNDSSVLAVAHLDTVVKRTQRGTTVTNTGAAGPVVHSGALDDRLGAYIVLEHLPALGITYDWLLTTGEESGSSTASAFTASKDYDWIIEFDRGGVDVVMYRYEDAETRYLVEDADAKVGLGSFTDICYLEHLGVKGFNWGVGYHDYHSVRGYAYLWDTWGMLAKFLHFHDMNYGLRLPHDKDKDRWGRGRTYRPGQGGYGWKPSNRDWWEDEDPYSFPGSSRALGHSAGTQETPPSEEEAVEAELTESEMFHAANAEAQRLVNKVDGVIPL